MEKLSFRNSGPAVAALAAAMATFAPGTSEGAPADETRLFCSGGNSINNAVECDVSEDGHRVTLMGEATQDAAVGLRCPTGWTVGGTAVGGTAVRARALRSTDASTPDEYELTGKIPASYGARELNVVCENTTASVAAEVPVTVRVLRRPERLPVFSETPVEITRRARNKVVLAADALLCNVNGVNASPCLNGSLLFQPELSRIGDKRWSMYMGAGVLGTDRFVDSTFPGGETRDQVMAILGKLGLGYDNGGFGVWVGADFGSDTEHYEHEKSVILIDGGIRLQTAYRGGVNGAFRVSGIAGQRKWRDVLPDGRTRKGRGGAWMAGAGVGLELQVPTP